MTFPVPNLDTNDMSWMPAIKDIPEKFKDNNSDIKPIAFFSDLFFLGVHGHNLAFFVRDGVDGANAWKALNSVLRNRSLKQEHKRATFAYLVDQWFSDFRYQCLSRHGGEGEGRDVPFDDAEAEASFQRKPGQLEITFVSRMKKS